MNEINFKAVGMRLEAVRKVIGLSKGDFARVFGLAPSVYARVIKGERLLQVHYAYRLHKIYNVPLDYIYTGKTTDLPPGWRGMIEKELSAAG